MKRQGGGIARGLTCGPHCVLRQWFNSLVLLWKICLRKLRQKSIVSYIVDVMFSKVSEYEDHL